MHKIGRQTQHETDTNEKKKSQIPMTCAGDAVFRRWYTSLPKKSQPRNCQAL
jgi:hypothetical protein